MAGSSFGTIFRITTWGESHGPAVGVTVDGCPAGIELSEELIQPFMDRRKPGRSRFATKRSESDTVRILSGVFEGKTTGTPITMLVQNSDHRSADYSDIADCFRPGHADFGFQQKYGFRDYRGGGRSSGRETAGRVAAGAVASAFLKELGISVLAYTRSIGPVEMEIFDPEEIFRNELYMPDAEKAAEAARYLEECMKNGDSSGGVIECVVKGLKPGIGEPVFDKLDACLGKALFSIGAVKGVEIGDGFAAARSTGSFNNDAFTTDSEGNIITATNHAGGILGGISSGNDIIIRAAVKPTPSISVPQRTVNTRGEEVGLTIRGRHDPVIVPRAVVVAESMAAVTLADAILMNLGSRMENVRKIWDLMP